MAITSAIMQMRRGNEADFDPDKMHPGEWAVSTDKKIVRMCFYPGVCVRMATYEAFEEDMEQIIAILEEAKTVQEAIEKIYEEFQKAELDIEAAENSAILSESYAHGGTGTRVDEDIDNAKYYAEQAKISADNAASVASVEIMTTEKAGIGKPDGKTITADEDGTMRVPSHSNVALNRQTLGYTKKNFLKNTAPTTTKNGVNFTVNDDGSVTVNGTATANAYFEMDKKFSPIQNGKHILSGCPSGGSLSTFYLAIYDNSVLSAIVKEVGLSKEVELDITHTYKPTISVLSGTTVNNLTFYPMIRSAEITDGTYEPYVDDVNTRLENVETEVIPIERGGTGGTTAKEAQYNLLKDIPERTAGLKDTDYGAILLGSPSADNGILAKFKLPLIWDYIKSKAEAIFAKKTEVTPVNNLIATVPGSPLDAVMGKELNDRIVTLEDAFINYYVSLINGWIGTLVVSVNKINKQVSITGFIDGTNATDTIFAKTNIEDNGVPVPVNAIGLIVQQGYSGTLVTVGFSNSGNGWEAKAPSTSHVYQFSTGYIMSN